MSSHGEDKTHSKPGTPVCHSGMQCPCRKAKTEEAHMSWAQPPRGLRRSRSGEPCRRRMEVVLEEGRPATARVHVGRQMGTLAQHSVLKAPAGRSRDSAGVDEAPAFVRTTQVQALSQEQVLLWLSGSLGPIPSRRSAMPMAGAV